MLAMIVRSVTYVTMVCRDAVLSRLMRGIGGKKCKRPTGITGLKKYAPIGHFWRPIDGVE